MKHAALLLSFLVPFLSLSQPSPTGLGLFEPALVVPATPPYPQGVNVRLAWDHDSTNSTYLIYWGYSTNQMTNVVQSSRKTVSFRAPEGTVLYFKATAVLDGLESPPSNILKHETGFFVDAASYIHIVRGYGRLGATNRIVEADSPNGPWSTLLTFKGTGQPTNALSLDSKQKYFRIVSP